jgi:hypothetical protein
VSSSKNPGAVVGALELSLPADGRVGPLVAVSIFEVASRQCHEHEDQRLHGNELEME